MRDDAELRPRKRGYRRLQSRATSSIDDAVRLRTVSARDLTESVENAERMARAIELLADGVIVSDCTGRILDWNRGAESVFGWGREEVLGRTLRSTIVPVHNREQALAGLLAYESGEAPPPTRRTEISALTKAGVELPVELTVAPFRTGRERTFRVFVRNLDETRRAQKEMVLLKETLVQAQKTQVLGLLAGGVAHDFNNILTVILGQSQLLLNAPDLATALRGRVEAIADSAVRASSLTAQLLAFSRRHVASPAALDLNEVISRTHEMLARVIGDDIEMDIVPGADLGSIEADRSQIEQVVLNLVVNARDAMPGGGKLTITTEAVVVDETRAATLQGCAGGRYVSLRVQDRGLGMDGSVMARIFEPFFTTKEVGHGAGLGLSTVYGIVRQNGGTILVSSEKDVGTTFEVLLPASRGVPQSTEASSPVPPARGEGRVLVVEDDDSVRSLAKEILELAGYDTLSRPSAREALGAIERLEGDVDLVVTDLVMKGMNGRQLASLLSKRFPKIMILFLSGHYGHPLFEPRARAAERGVERQVVHKPFIPSELVRAVAEAFEKRARQAEETRQRRHPGS